ncbi:MAG: HD domain-containing protein [Lachnospiraceae bacterium]|nr:HD domain-containing protein [Lachnospiraceae bacterium]
MLQIDREKAKKAFDSHTAKYNMSEVKIRLKAEHTYRVADIAERIASSLYKEDAFVDFAWFLGLLHDVGRFEQVKRFDTFNDAISVDHAEFGADLLFKEGLICEFLPEEIEYQHPSEDTSYWLSVAETAIRLHNKLTVPEGLDQKTLEFSHLLRDADKADIFKVLTEIPFEERTSGFQGIPGQIGARDEVMKYVYAHKCVPRMTIRTEFETLISHACMGFELVYDETKRVVKSQGYLKEYLKWTPKNDKEKEQLAILQGELAELID